MEMIRFHAFGVGTVMLAAALTACGEVSAPLTDPGTELVPAAPGGFALVHVRPNTPDQARGAVTNNLADAASRVASGGTIEVHAGTYVTHDVLIDKPVTIEGNGDPLIVNEAGSASLIVGGIGTGEVTIRGITFRDDVGTHPSGPAASIALEADFGHVIVEESAFSGVVGETRSIYQRVVTTAGTPALTTHDNTFEGGFRALNVFNFGGPDVQVSLVGNDAREFTDRTFYLTAASGTVRDNDFTRCGLTCVFPQAVQSMTVEENRFEACGANATALGLGTGCIFFRFADEGVVRGNHVSDRTTGTGEHFGILVLNVAGFPTDGKYLIENNVVDGCGEGSCIVTDGNTQATVRGNHVTMYDEDGTPFGIISSGFSGPGSDVIEENVFVGSAGGGIFVNGGNTAVVNGNTVSGSHFALFVSNGGVVSAGVDNVFDDVGHAVALGTGPLGTGTATVNRSDLTGIHVNPVFWDDPSAVADLTCNWWGSASGPSHSGPDPIPPGIEVVPFAEAPIAGTGQTSCSGGL